MRAHQRKAQCQAVFGDAVQGARIGMGEQLRRIQDALEQMLDITLA